MLKLKQQFMGPKASVAMLIAAGTGTLLFTLIAGALVYESTRRLVSAASWVDHTYQVLSSIQTASQTLDGIEHNTRMFLVTGNEAPIRTARLAANQLDLSASHIGSLVQDNINQTPDVANLTACSADLTRSLDGLSKLMVFPASQIQRCRDTMGLMAQQEQRLLAERDRRSRHTSHVSTYTELGFIGISLVTLAVLFAFLLRDAVLRQRASARLVLTNKDLAKMVRALEDQAHESKLLTAFRDELQLAVDLKQVHQSASVTFALMAPGSSGALCIINSSRNLVEVVSSWGETAMGNFNAPESCCGLRLGQTRWREPGGSEIDCTHFTEAPPERYVCMPIVAHGDTLGVLFLECEDDESCAAIRHGMDGLRQLLQLTGMAVASLNLKIKLENQSIRDSLTGLFNRRFMQISLERELARANRRSTILAVFMMDIDHFKNFNDTWGHAAGDAVLKAAAEVYLNIVRAEDVVCRYGGEEFTVLLPDMTPEAAYERAEIIRQAVANLRVAVNGEISAEVTVSIGIALFPNDGKTAEQLLLGADQALYAAKRSGRNRVSFSNSGVLAADG